MTRFVKAALFLFIMSTLTIGAVRAESTVLITGSNRGIGLELARQYADLGHKVIATARTPDKADDLKELAASNPNVIIEQLDVTDHAQIDALAEKYKGQAIDILFNNAGMSGGPDGGQEFGQIDYDAFPYRSKADIKTPVYERPLTVRKRTLKQDHLRVRIRAVNGHYGIAMS